MFPVITEMSRDDAVALFGQHYTSGEEQVAQRLGAPGMDNGFETPEEAAAEARRRWRRRTEIKLESEIDHLKGFLDWPAVRGRSLRAAVTSRLGWGSERAWAKQWLSDTTAKRNLLAETQERHRDILEASERGLSETTMSLIQLAETIKLDGYLPVGTPVYIVKTNRDDLGPTIEIVEDQIVGVEARHFSSDDFGSARVHHETRDTGFYGDAIDPATGAIETSIYGWYLFVSRQGAEHRAHEIARLTISRFDPFLGAEEA